jgi:hypothetical protein
MFLIVQLRVRLIIEDDEIIVQGQEAVLTPQSRSVTILTAVVK